MSETIGKQALCSVAITTIFIVVYHLGMKYFEKKQQVEFENNINKIISQVCKSINDDMKEQDIVSNKRRMFDAMTDSLIKSSEEKKQ